MVLKSNWFEQNKCCFPLAEARKIEKRKTFFSHTSGSLGASMRGLEVPLLMRFEFPTFLVAARHCLTSCPPTPSSFFGRFFLEDSFSISCLLWGVLFVFILLVYTAVFILFSGLVCSSCYESTLSKYLFFHWFSLWLIKVRLHGSAWHGYQLWVRK